MRTPDSDISKPEFHEADGVQSTNHWISQRLSSVVLIPLTIVFVYNFVTVSNASYDEVIQTFRQPFNAISTALFLVISLWHFRQGIEVVIEDYIHEFGTKKMLLSFFGILCWLLSTLVIFSFITIYIK